MSHADWLPVVVAELRKVSADLLEAGLAEPKTIGRLGGHGPLLRALLRQADKFVALAPKIVDDVVEAPEHYSEDWEYSRTPLHSRPSRAPQDQGVLGERLVPLSWLREASTSRIDPDAIAWAAGVGDTIRKELASQGSRLVDQLLEAQATRAGHSQWAQSDAEAINRMSEDVQARQASVHYACQALYRLTSRTRSVRKRGLPSPFPMKPAWRQLRLLSRSVMQPETLLVELVNDLLSEPIAVADVPFLYQRWCALLLVRSIEQRGWKRGGDLIGPLYLGGRLQFVHPDGSQLTLWVEPRVSEETRAMTGWACNRPHQELTPDFLLVAGPIGYRDAFVLDATLSCSPERLRIKHVKYSSEPGIVGHDVHVVAGVPLMRRPIRTWAVAPVSGSHCQVADHEGRMGTVPLHPLHQDFNALQDWVDDVLLHSQRLQVKLDAGARGSRHLIA